MLLDRDASDFCVEDVGVEVGAVGPGDGAGFGVGGDLGEVGGVGEGGEDAGEVDHAGDVDLALDAVLEAEVDAVLAQRAGFDDILQHGATPAVQINKSGCF